MPTSQIQLVDTGHADEGHAAQALTATSALSALLVALMPTNFNTMRLTHTNEVSSRKAPPHLTVDSYSFSSNSSFFSLQCHNPVTLSFGPRVGPLVFMCEFYVLEEVFDAPEPL